MSKYLKHVMFLLIFTSLSHLDAEIIRRAAFDFGSGKIKVQVADVDTNTHKILHTVYSEDKAVQLSEDAAQQPEGQFSEEIQKQALATAQSFKEKAIEFGAVEFRGLATEAYRKAPNGQELASRYLSELGITATIVSQMDEGKMGFFALVAENNLDSDRVISWDIGGGSFQITYCDPDGNIQVYMAPFGRSTTKNAIIKYVKGLDPSVISSPNPMSLADWEASLQYFNTVLPQVPEELMLKLKKAEVQLIGIATHPTQLRDLKTYHIEDICKVLQERLDKSDNELAQTHNSPPSAVSELVLVYSIIQKLQATSVNYIRTLSGSTSGLLISEEYWEGRKRL
jgi:exopolyphosphatase / guanosine-5'-triphosphate,3'-diphosphate pyrophosphatase